MRVLFTALFAAALSASCGAATPRNMDAFRWQRRVILVAAPGADDPRLLAQRRALADWRQGAEDRDVTVVEIVGAAVDGVRDPADALRGRYALPPDRFSVVLVGKDGHVAVRSDEPMEGSVLSRTIDAMPMRRAGQR